MRVSLKAARINAGLTQKEAANMLNVAKETVSNWEKGKSYPDIFKIEDIERIYNVTYDEIIFLPNNSTKSVKEFK